MLWYIDYFNILRTNKHMRKVKSNKMKDKIKVHGKVGVAYTLAFVGRILTTHGYLVEEENCLRSDFFHNIFTTILQ